MLGAHPHLDDPLRDRAVRRVEELVEGLPVLRMQQVGQARPDEVVGLPPEQARDGRAGVADHALGGEHDRGVAGALQQGTDGGAEVHRLADDPDEHAVAVDAGIGHQGRERRPVPTLHGEAAGPGDPVAQRLHDLGTDLPGHVGHGDLGDVAPQHLVRGPAVEALRGGVPVHDEAGGIGGDDGLAQRVQQLGRCQGHACGGSGGRVTHGRVPSFARRTLRGRDGRHARGHQYSRPRRRAHRVESPDFEFSPWRIRGVSAPRRPASPWR